MSTLNDEDGIPVEVDQGESLIVDMTFKDPDRETFNKAAIQDITATLLNKKDYSIINSRSEQTVLDSNGGVLETDGSFELTLSPDDNPIIDETLSEEVHILIVSFTWVDEASNTQKGIEKYLITVKNIESPNEAVRTETTIPDMDLTGIKRVKTKHIEIETHDPRAVQEARDRELTPHPSFCSLYFCKGVPK